MQKAVHKPARIRLDAASRGRLAASDAKRLSMPRRNTPSKCPVTQEVRLECTTDLKEKAKIWLEQVKSVDKRGFSPKRLKSSNSNQSAVR
jgi:hypothetical protein